jgi:hypothetical protein
MIIPSEYDKHAPEVRGTVTNRGALAAVRRLCSTFSRGDGYDAIDFEQRRAEGLYPP